jgi:hypothetical protein
LYNSGAYETFDYPRVLIDISSVKTLKSYIFDQNLVLGANISLEDCITIFKEAATTKNEFAYLKQFANHLELVANPPVRKVTVNNYIINYFAFSCLRTATIDFEDEI